MKAADCADLTGVVFGSGRRNKCKWKGNLTKKKSSPKKLLREWMQRQQIHSFAVYYEGKKTMKS